MSIATYALTSTLGATTFYATVALLALFLSLLLGDILGRATSIDRGQDDSGLGMFVSGVICSGFILFRFALSFDQPMGNKAPTSSFVAYSGMVAIAWAQGAITFVLLLGFVWLFKNMILS